MPVQSITWAETLKNKSVFPMELRSKLEATVERIGRVKDTGDTEFPKKMIGEVGSYLKAANLSVQSEGITIWPTRFSLDLFIKGRSFGVAVEVETGKGARIELDLLKLMAFARQTSKAPDFPIYGWLLVSDKHLLRTTTGTQRETGFRYTKRVLRLLDLPASGLGDLLITEFPTSSI